MPAAGGEFGLIARHFTHRTSTGAWASQGVGDDCALIDLADRRLAVTSDMLLAGRHFFPDVDPESLGHKALAVNLSDLAAAGASPRAFFLAIALPAADEAWLTAFSRGLMALARAHGCALLGGDTTRTPSLREGPGPLTICITAMGELPAGAGLSRAGAAPGDEIWVSGELGDAAAGLKLALGEISADMADAATLRERLEWPQPRVALGEALRGVASAAMDVSDGLLGDLRHILERSGVGAELVWERIPLSPALRRQPLAVQRDCALAGGDDYELLFTAPPARRAALLAAGRAAKVPLAHIGQIGAAGLVLRDAAGAPIELAASGYDHFA